MAYGTFNIQNNPNYTAYLAAKKAAKEKPKDMLMGQVGSASDFAGQGEAGYGDMTAELAKRRAFLEALARGENSVAMEQVRQGGQQAIAGQQAMAAGARPANAAMAARTAAMNAGRIQSGMAGQGAMAGLLERQQAEQALANMNLGQRGQDIQVGLGGRGLAMGGLGTLINAPKDPSWYDRLMGLVGAGLGAYSISKQK
jgi:hypothetical protein